MKFRRREFRVIDLSEAPRVVLFVWESKYEVFILSNGWFIKPYQFEPTASASPSVVVDLELRRRLTKAPKDSTDSHVDDMAAGLMVGKQTCSHP